MRHDSCTALSSFALLKSSLLPSLSLALSLALSVLAAFRSKKVKMATIDDVLTIHNVYAPLIIVPMVLVYYSPESTTCYFIFFLLAYARLCLSIYIASFDCLLE